MLLTPSGGPFDGRRSLSWREAARLPLCLLTRDMQNRRIVERLFSEGGAAAPRVAIETNSVLALVAHVRSGGWSSVIPHTFMGVLGRGDEPAGFIAIPLVEPEAAHTVGIVLHERDPLPPLARALLKSARDNDIAAALDSRSPRPA
jgi:DNA-binding transcriptional LysR family regulator